MAGVGHSEVGSAPGCLVGSHALGVSEALSRYTGYVRMCVIGIDYLRFS